MECRVIVRLVTSSWTSREGIHTTQSLRYLKRKCIGHNFVEEDASIISAGDVMTRIINLHKCVDGIYEVVICNEFRDYETGNVEDYDYKLVPYTEEKPTMYSGILRTQPLHINSTPCVSSE